MSYGLSVQNDSGYQQIDSEAPRLLKLYDGSYSGQSGFGVTFPAPITSAEPPCIFIRPGPGQASVLHRSMIINGSPGNWTGFTVFFSNVKAQAYGTWFVAIFGATTLSSYGLRLWDASGNPIYDTGSPAVSVSNVASDWFYGGSVQLDLGFAYFWYCPLPKPIGANDHFMINPFSRWLLSAHPTNSIQMGVTVDYSSNRLVMYAVGTTGPWIDIGKHAGVFARFRR